MNRNIGLTAACLATGLLGGAIAHLSLPRETQIVQGSTGTVAPPGGTLATTWKADVLARLVALEESVARMELAAPGDPGGREPVPTPAGDAQGEVLEEIAALKSGLDAMKVELSKRSTPVGGPVFIGGGRRANQERSTVEEAQAKALDSNSTEAEKLEAWTRLRSGGWTEDVVAEMVAVAQMTSDPEVRADIWRQADAEDRSLQLVQPLLHSLAHDPNASVRSEAAETLENYLDQPGVRAALEYALEHDPDQGVRKEARGALN
ncbi:MAG: HEAT repeat domain-containing protein [Planctomycetota bacterium]